MIGNCNYANTEITKFYLTKWTSNVITYFSPNSAGILNNQISNFINLSEDWNEIVLNTANVLYSQSFNSPTNPNGINYTESITISVPEADVSKWADLTPLLANRYIVIFGDANGNYWCLGHKFGLKITSYNRTENAYNVVFSSNSSIPLLIGVINTYIEYINTGTMPSPSPTPSITPSISVTPSITPTISVTPSISVSATPSISVSPSISVTPTSSISATPSISASMAVSPSVSETPSNTPTPSISATPSISISATPSISVSPSLSETPSITPSTTPTPMPTPTESLLPTPSARTDATPKIKLHRKLTVYDSTGISGGNPDNFEQINETISYSGITINHPLTGATYDGSTTLAFGEFGSYNLDNAIGASGFTITRSLKRLEFTTAYEYNIYRIDFEVYRNTSYLFGETDFVDYDLTSGTTEISKTYTFSSAIIETDLIEFVLHVHIQTPRVPYPSVTSSISVTPSISETPSVTPTVTPSMSITPTPTPSITPSPSAPAQVGFTTEWSVSGDEAARTITLPFTDNGTYDATIYWGDGAVSGVTSYDDTNAIHTYDSDGTYQIEIRGSAPGWSINNGGDKDKLTKIINWGHPSVFSGFSYIDGGFYGCSNLTHIEPNSKIQAKNDLTSFDSVFQQTGITGLTSNMLDNLVNVTSLEFTFCYSTSFVYIPQDLLKYMTEITTINGPWEGCSSLENSGIPNDLYRYQTKVTTLAGAMRGTAITYIPADFFKYNVSVDNFSNCLRDNTSLSAVTDSNLFKWATGSTIYTSNAFQGCSNLETVVDGLLDEEQFIDFNYMFADCTKLQVSPWLFYATSGETATRFLDKNINFQGCFFRASFNGTQGTAPDIWNCDYGVGSASKTACFYGDGNSTTSLTNYNDIPNDWKSA